MKKILLSCLLCSLVMLLMAACSSAEEKGNEDDKPGGSDGEPTLSISPSKLSFDKTGGTKYIMVSTDQKTWDAVSDKTWCKVVKMEADRKLAVTVEPMAESKIETATITITVTNGALKTEKIATVTQVGGDVDYLIEIPEYDESMIYDVVVGGVKKAEICREYIRSATVDSVLSVIYKVDNKGVAISDKGYLVNGTEVVWDKENNTCLIEEIGELADAKAYISNDGELIFESNRNELPAELKPHFLVDNRPGDAYNYKMVKIGLQYWMGENLRACKYTDGTPILTKLIAADWAAATEPACCSFREIDATIETEYKTLLGLWYNPIAAKADKVAPEGWRVTLASDWETMIAYLGEKSVGKVKEEGTSNWSNFSGANMDPGEGGYKPGNNRSGFTALPAGYYALDGQSFHYGLSTYFWAPKEDDPYYYFFFSYNYEGDIGATTWAVNGGYSLRCVKK